MLVKDVLSVIEGFAPACLAQPWDNSGLQVGDSSATSGRVLASLELTEDVLAEAVSGGFDTILTHHPVLFSPVQSLVEHRPKERLLRRVVEQHMNVISCHTNLDSADGGLADIAAEALGLRDTRPLETAAAGWVKLVGFIPADAVDEVARVVFAAGAGGVGRYSGCAFSCSGTGWFTPEKGATPTVGELGGAERVEEIRWETVLPRHRAAAVLAAYVGAHPYEEPAFDLVPVEDVLPNVGLGRVGQLGEQMRLEAFVGRVAERFGVEPVIGGGVRGRTVQRVAVVPGSGRGMVEKALGECDVLVTGDLTHHDAEQATERGLVLVDVPHGEVEWWAFKEWVGRLSVTLGKEGVQVKVSERWCSPWSRLGEWLDGCEEEH